MTDEPKQISEDVEKATQASIMKIWIRVAVAFPFVFLISFLFYLFLDYGLPHSEQLPGFGDWVKEVFWNTVRFKSELYFVLGGLLWTFSVSLNIGLWLGTFMIENVLVSKVYSFFLPVISLFIIFPSIAEDGFSIYVAVYEVVCLAVYFSVYRAVFKRLRLGLNKTFTDKKNT